VEGPASGGRGGVFGEEKTEPAQEAVDVKMLHAKIGALALENDFLEGALTVESAYK
jgi:hypothetical protein